MKYRATQLSSFCYAGRYASSPEFKNAPSESARFSAVRSFIRCALRLKIRHLGVAQLVARYLGVVEPQLQGAVGAFVVRVKGEACLEKGLA